MSQTRNINRQIVLASRPHGEPVAENFRLVESRAYRLLKMAKCYCKLFIYH